MFAKTWQQLPVDEDMENLLINFQHLLLQLQNLLLQFPHLGLLPVSGRLGCHPVLQFPAEGGRMRRSRRTRRMRRSKTIK